MNEGSLSGWTLHTSELRGSRVRHTKIIATLGPASDAPATLDALIAAGADVVRLNFSHGTQPEHAARFARVREAALRAGQPVAVLQISRGRKFAPDGLKVEVRSRSK